MAVSMCRGTILASLILIFSSAATTQKVFKITRIECISVDKNFSTFEYCRLKAIRRNVAAFSFKLHLHQIVRDCWANIELLRKYNGYKPFILNTSINACKFMSTQSNRPSIFAVVYALFAKYSNLNHTCPYEGTVLMEKFYPEHDNLFLPIPSGDYLLRTSCTMQKQIRTKLNVWFSFEEKEKIPNVKPR